MFRSKLTESFESKRAFSELVKRLGIGNSHVTLCPRGAWDSDWSNRVVGLDTDDLHRLCRYLDILISPPLVEVTLPADYDRILPA